MLGDLGGEPRELLLGRLGRQSSTAGLGWSAPSLRLAAHALAFLRRGARRPAPSSCAPSEQPAGGRARFIGDLGARQHARNLFAPRQRFERRERRCRRLPLAFALLDQEMMMAARRHLRAVRNDKHLRARRQAWRAARRPHPQPRRRCRDRPRRRSCVPAAALARQHDLQGEHETRKLAARGDLFQRARSRSRIGPYTELDAVEPGGPARSSGNSSIPLSNAALPSFSGASSRLTAASSLAAAARRRFDRSSAASTKLCARRRKLRAARFAGCRPPERIAAKLLVDLAALVRQLVRAGRDICAPPRVRRRALLHHRQALRIVAQRIERASNAPCALRPLRLPCARARRLRRR